MKYDTHHHPPPQKQRRSLGARYGPVIGTVLKQTPQASVTVETRNKKPKPALPEEGYITKTKFETKTFQNKQNLRDLTMKSDKPKQTRKRNYTKKIMNDMFLMTV